MSNTLVLSKSARKAPSTPEKQPALKNEDLQLVAERLSLIQGHISQMPDGCISGVKIMNGFLLVALKFEGHELSVSGGAWMLDGKSVTDY